MPSAMHDHDTNTAVWKMIIIWIATAAGNVTLNSAVLFVTLIYTLLQIFSLLRRLWKDMR